MKKFFCFILFLSVLVGSVAIADYYTLSFTAKNGKYSPVEIVKMNYNGSNARVSINYVSSNSHSMYYQIRKISGAEATEYKIKKGTGSLSLAYGEDGHGETLGRNGYWYKLRVAHRSQCKCTSGRATVSVEFEP